MQLLALCQECTFGYLGYVSDTHRPPVSAMVEKILGCKWSIRLLQIVAVDTARPSAVLRACPGLSAKVMNERWRKLIRYGIVIRTVRGDRPPIEVEYALTPLGRRFMAILDEVRQLQDDLDNTTVPADDDPAEDDGIHGRAVET